MSAWFFFFHFVIFKSVRKIINVSCNTLFSLQRCSFIKYFLHFSLADECANEAFFFKVGEEPRGEFSFIVFRSFVHRIIGLAQHWNEDQRRNLLINQEWKSPNFTARISHRFLSRYSLKSFRLHAVSTSWCIIKISAQSTVFFFNRKLS